MEVIIWIFGSIVSVYVIKRFNCLLTHRFDRIPLELAIGISILLTWVSVIIFILIIIAIIIFGNNYIRDYFKHIKEKFNSCDKDIK